MGIVRYIIGLCLLLTIIGADAQSINYQQEYLKAKEFFRDGRWGLAQDTFEKLTTKSSDNPFSAYASFYYALSAYKQGYLALSRDMLLQTGIQYPEWDKSDEVRYWLSQVYFELDNFHLAFAYGNEIRDSNVLEDELKKQQFFIRKRQSVDSVKVLYDSFPSSYPIGEQLAYLISRQTLLERDLDLLKELSEKFELDLSESTSMDGIKDHYEISLLFPFLAKELEPSTTPKINQFVLDYYQGIALAVDSLNRSGSALTLNLFDTERDTSVTRELLRNNIVRESDLIIGPIYNNHMITDFTKKHEINVIHPFARDRKLIESNPYALLYSVLPTDVGQKAASFVLSDTTNKSGLVFFGETERDSLMATSFIDSVTRGGFNIILSKKIHPGEEREALKILASGSVVNKLELEEMTLPPDSIDLIFVASTGSGGSIYSNVLAGVEARGDSIPVLGSHNWLHDDVVSKSIFGRLPVSMMAYDLINYHDSTFIKFQAAYRAKYGTNPSKFAVLGYDMMMFFGNELQTHGKYFQRELRTQHFTQGPLTYGFDYQGSNSNKAIAIIKWDGDKVILLDSWPYSGDQITMEDR